MEGIDANAGHRLKLIAPFDQLIAVQKARLRRASRARVLRHARSAIAAARPALGLWTAADAHITLLPYQLEPALAVLGGATRVLLADAVGLGKTVQAGLILAELRARGLVDRALILTPAGLRHAWAAELLDRFGLMATVMDQKTLTTHSWMVEADVNPWTCHDIVVASIDFVKRPDVLTSVESAPFDLLIADEAHHLTPGSDRGAIVQRLGARTPWVILASATPHSGDEAAFTYLTTLGAHRDPLAIFKRQRNDIGMASARRTTLLAVTPTSAEAAMLEAVDRYTHAIWRARGAAEPAVQLVATTLRRRAASSATAFFRTMTRRLALLSGGVEPRISQPCLPWEEAESADSDEPDDLLAVRGLDNPEEERGLISHIVGLADRAQSASSKIGCVLRFVARSRESVVVFTEFRDTLDALATRLTAVRSVSVIHGGLPMELRRESIERFNRGDVTVLLATDAAGEGLNLQHRCRWVINVELPWNPLRLEQRIGRVDRIGQSRRVHAVHLFHRGTVEDTVLGRLERRRVRARTRLSEVREWLSERDVASAVFGDGRVESHAPPRVASIKIARASDEARRLEAQRVWRIRAPDRFGPIWTAQQCVGDDSLVLLFESRHVDLAGRLLESGLDAVLVGLSRAPTNRKKWILLIKQLERAEAIHARLVEASLANGKEIERALSVLRSAVVNRVSAIRDVLATSRRRQLQVSLFDRRTEQDEERRLETLDRIDHHLARKAALLHDATPALEPSRATLVAAWPFGPAHPSTTLGMTLSLSKGQGRPLRVGL